MDPADSVSFDTGYDRAALESYAVFKRLRGEGAIPAHVRFQFALPTPLATGLMYVSPNGREGYVAAYERSLMAALGKILAGIPHEDLSIQIDVCQEVLLFEGYFPETVPDYKGMVFRQFGRLAAAIPESVELGFHLCYGSPGDQPLLNLGDGTVLAELMNGIAAEVRRRVEFIHIPVPQGGDRGVFRAAARLAAPARHVPLPGPVAAQRSGRRPAADRGCPHGAGGVRGRGRMRVRAHRSRPAADDPGRAPVSRRIASHRPRE